MAHMNRILVQSFRIEHFKSWLLMNYARGILFKISHDSPYSLSNCCWHTSYMCSTVIPWQVPRVLSSELSCPPPKKKKLNTGRKQRRVLHCAGAHSVDRNQQIVVCRDWCIPQWGCCLRKKKETNSYKTTFMSGDDFRARTTYLETCLCTRHT